MRLSFKTLSYFVFLIFFTFGLAGAEFPKYSQGKVSDFANIIDDADEASLVQLCNTLETRNGAQLAIVTVSSLDGLSVEEYTNKLFNQWGVGHKGVDDGIMLLVAPNERKMRIEVGYGLEGVVPDGKAGRILDESVVPYFKAGQMSTGILRGSQQIAATVLNDQSIVTVAALPQAEGDQKAGLMESIFMLGFFGIFVSIGFFMFGTGIKGSKFFLIWGGFFGGMPLLMSIAFGKAFGFPVYILPIVAVIMVGLGLKFGNKVITAGGKGSGGRGGWSSGGGSWGGSSGGSSFGGGSSGGGGSSRSW